MISWKTTIIIEIILFSSFIKFHKNIFNKILMLIKCFDKININVNSMLKQNTYFFDINKLLKGLRQNKNNLCN